jgi:hypothetical protein
VYPRKSWGLPAIRVSCCLGENQVYPRKSWGLESLYKPTNDDVSETLSPAQERRMLDRPSCISCFPVGDGMFALWLPLFLYSFHCLGKLTWPQSTNGMRVFIREFGIWREDWGSKSREQ